MPTTATLSPTGEAAPTAPATPVACQYLDPAHRPRLGWCPDTCHGPVGYAERLGDGRQHVYCDAHADWRRRSSRLPSLVRRLATDELPEPTPT